MKNVINSMLVAAVILTAFSAASPARNGAYCFPHETITKQLKSKYGESKIGQGLVNEATKLEFYMTPNGSTYTVLSRQNARVSCIVIAGRDWTFFQPKVEPAGKRT